MRVRWALVLSIAASCAGARAFIRMPMAATLQPESAARSRLLTGLKPLTVKPPRSAGPPPAISPRVLKHPAAAAQLAVKRCSGLADFSAAVAAQNAGLLVQRPLRTLDALANVGFDEVQQCVERAATDIDVDTQQGQLVVARLPLGVAEWATKKEVETLQGFHELLLEWLQQPEIVQLLVDDAKVLCAAMKRIAAGKCNGLEIKVELIGANSCRKWHHDHFVGRSIVTYTGLQGTTFCDSPATNLEQIVKSEAIATVASAEVGDILFIKGAKYDADGDGW
jgi:hypothetical protein